jgi:hypothetical protein
LAASSVRSAELGPRSFIGRLKGLAELRGVTEAVEAFRAGRIM